MDPSSQIAQEMTAVFGALAPAEPQFSQEQAEESDDEQHKFYSLRSSAQDPFQRFDDVQERGSLEQLLPNENLDLLEVKIPNDLGREFAPA